MRERFAIQLVGPPAVEPVSVDEAKLHLRVDGDEENTYVGALVSAAREACEARSGRALVSTTFRLTLDRFPPFAEAQYQPLVSGPAPAVLNTWPLDPSLLAILIPRSPLQQVSSIAYVDAAGATQTLAGSGYLVDADSEPARIVPAVGASWPSTQYRPAAATVTFVAGYATPLSANFSTDVLTARGRTYANGDVLRLTNAGGALPAPLATGTDYYVVQTTGATFKLSLTAGGAAIDLTDAGTGQHFVGFVPEAAKLAIKLLLAHWYESREAVVVGSGATELPFAVDALLATIAVPNVW